MIFLATNCLQHDELVTDIKNFGEQFSKKINKLSQQQEETLLKLYFKQRKLKKNNKVSPECLSTISIQTTFSHESTISIQTVFYEETGEYPIKEGKNENAIETRLVDDKNIASQDIIPSSLKSTSSKELKYNVEQSSLSTGSVESGLSSSKLANDSSNYHKVIVHSSHKENVTISCSHQENVIISADTENKDEFKFRTSSTVPVVDI